ncbi:hypothetical protein K466DRAFT_667066 [Polyporus arcularius HHB13444]|uniref:Uncharacterized protein n=1 Tax=Polyporus arcularius HHB13444 TaxID=1314778 RepID=A0A5C3NVL4_9APHY|nr:hypothetical protein K466DRAFT_667066 [Polyporus arcularius HHB13444]
MDKTPPPPPNDSELHALFGSDSDVRRDITLLSYLLSQVQYEKDFFGKSKAADKSDSNMLEAWSHLAFMLTTGDTNDPAVTGQVESDAITAAVVTRNVSHRSSHASQTSQFLVSKLEAQKTGKQLLNEYFSTSMDVPYSEHAADVFAILKCLFAPVPNPAAVASKRTLALTIFIARRCQLKLRAHINQGTKLWLKHPLELSHSWYHGPVREKPVSKQFLLPAGVQDFLVSFNLHPEPVPPSKEGDLTYTVSQDTTVSWVDMLNESLKTMREMYRPSDQWDGDEAYALYKAIVILHYAAIRGVLEHLVTSELAAVLAANYSLGAQSSSKLGEAIMTLSRDPATASPSATASPPAAAYPPATASPPAGTFSSIAAPGLAMGEAKVEDQPEDGGNETGEDKRDNQDSHEGIETVPEDIPVTGEGAGAFMVRYLRTLCIPYAAARYNVLYGERMPSRNIRFEAYMLSSKPSIPSVTVDTVHEFAHRFFKRFAFPQVDSEDLTSVFKTLAKPLARGPLDVAEHAEATLMAFAYSSRCEGGTVHGTVPGPGTLSTVLSMFQAPRVPVGVSKKCCFCCYTLAALLKKHARLDFVLQGTHSVIYPWVPPDGIPVGVLIDLRLALVRVLYDTIAEAVKTVRPLQTLLPVSIKKSPRVN